MAVKDYSTNPDDNLAISGINIAEGMPPGLVNNAIRQMMSDVKNYSDTQDTTITGVEEKIQQVKEIANGKAPGGYGLGEQNGRNVHDANNALEAGWWTPDNNQNALNFYDLNHPLLVIARNVWGTVQIQFVSGKIAVRELSNSVWSEWSLAQVGYADNAGNAQKLAGLTPTLINSTDNSNWLLALGNGSDIVTRRPQDVSVSYSDVSGTAYDSKKISSIVVYTNTTRYITYPPGGTYVMVAQYHSNGCAVRDRTAGGAVVDMGNPVAVAIFIPV